MRDLGPVLAKGGLFAFLMNRCAASPADEKLELFHGRWRGSVDPIFAEFAY